MFRVDEIYQRAKALSFLWYVLSRTSLLFWITIVLPMLWLVFHNRWMAGEESVRERSEEWPTEAKSMMGWEFTQNTLSLSLRDRDAVGILAVQGFPYLFLWWNNSQWRACDVIGMRLCFLPPYNNSSDLYIYFIFFIKHSHIRHCVTDLQILPQLILIATV